MYHVLAFTKKNNSGVGGAIMNEILSWFKINGYTLMMMMMMMIITGFAYEKVNTVLY